MLLLAIVGCDPAKIGEDDLPGGVGEDTDEPGNPDETDEPGEETGEPPEVDSDGDGYTPEGGDCDDDNGDVYPGAPETDDGLDNDCDEYADEREVCAGVDGAFETIQGAIDDAPQGGVVLVCPGDYAENLLIQEKAVSVIGKEGAEVTAVFSAVEDGAVLTVLWTAEADIQGLTFTGGVAESGAGITCFNAALSLTNSIVTENQATNEGAGLSASNCDLQVAGTTFSRNTAGGYGGGIYATGSAGSIDGAIIEDNAALEGGGAFLYNNTLDLTASVVRGNSTTSTDEEAWGPGAGGGGLWFSGTGLVDGNTFDENYSAYSGGGVYIYNSDLTFSNNAVTNNTNGEDGAGLFCNYCYATITGNVFEGNVAADDAGGLRLYVGSGCVVEDNEFYSNSAADDGGGAKFSHSAHEYLSNYSEGNVAGDAGGGLELDNDSTLVSDSTFVGNTAARGAGMHNWRVEWGTMIVRDSVFEGNTATDCGGGLAFDNTPGWRVSLVGLQITGNSAVDGGAICSDIWLWDHDEDEVADYYEESYFALSNSVLTDNAADDDGGAIYAKSGQIRVTNVVMDGNSGPGAAAVAIKGSAGTLTNSILTDNSGDTLLLVEDEELEEETLPGSLLISYSNLYGNTGGFSGLNDPTGSDGNIAVDPDFTGDYELDAGSPCIDAGDPTITDADGTRSDMGAYGGPNGG